MDQLDFRRYVCNVYYRRYVLDRPSIGRPMGRPKKHHVRVPIEIRTDGIRHYIEAISTQRRCAVCGLKVKKQCTKCNVGLHINNCFTEFHASQ